MGKRVEIVAVLYPKAGKADRVRNSESVYVVLVQDLIHIKRSSSLWPELPTLLRIPNQTR
jgi:hypothetical protein